MCMTSYVTPSWGSGKTSKDSKIATQNLREKVWYVTKMFK